MGCDGSVTYLSLEPYPREGVGPAHSREVPLPLTRGEIGSPLTGNGFPYAEGWRPRYPADRTFTRQCSSSSHLRLVAQNSSGAPSKQLHEGDLVVGLDY